MAIKKEIFKQLDEIVGEDTILATNTSSLSVTEISTANVARAASSACTSSTRRRCRGSSRS